MNIFYTDASPIISAQNLVDKHCVKMIIESAQLLSTAHRVLDGVERKQVSKTGRNIKRWLLPDFRESVLMQSTHINHPCGVWVRQSKENYYWLYNHLVAMTAEYTYRYGKRHKCCERLGILGALPYNIPQTTFNAPPSCMDDKYKISDNVIENYRNFYRIGKQHIHKWSKRQPPEWVFNA